MTEGIEEGSFRYDAETGERLSGLYNKLTTGEFIFSVGAGLVVHAGNHYRSQRKISAARTDLSL